MKKLTLFFALATLGFACEEDEPGVSLFLWEPLLEVNHVGDEVRLKVTDPRPFIIYDFGVAPISGDHINIYYSEDLENFALYKEVAYEDGEYVLDGLKPDRTYYLRAEGVKEGFKPGFSHIVVAYIGQLGGAQPYTQVNEAMKNAVASPDGKFVFYQTDRQGGADSNGQVLRLANRLTGVESDIEESSFGFSWDPDKNQLVYVRNTLSNNILEPTQLKIYNAENGETILLDDDISDLYIADIHFSEDNDYLIVQAAKKQAVLQAYDIYHFDLNTREWILIKDFDTEVFRTSRGFSMSSDERKFYFAVYSHPDSYEQGIYEYDMQSDVITEIFSSPWFSYSPELSPGGDQLLYVSERTGKNEVWVYDLTTSGDQQVSGGSQGHTYRGRESISWLDDNTAGMILQDNISGQGTFMKVTIK